MTSAERSPTSSPIDEASRQLKAWKNLSTPRDPIEGIMTGLKAFGGDGRDRHDPPRHHGRHQRDAGTQGRDGRLCDDARFPRRAVYRPRQPQVSLRYRLGEAEAVGQAAQCFEVDERIGPSGSRYRDARRSRRCAALARAIAPKARSKRSPSCSCIPISTPEHELRVKSIFAEERARHAGLDLLRGAAEVEGTFPLLDHDLRRFHQAGRRQAARPIMRRELDERRTSRANVVVMRSNGGEMTLEAAAGSADPDRGFRARRAA